MILAGRQGLPHRQTWTEQQNPSTRKVIDQILEMEAAGVTVIPLQLDISNPESVRTKLSTDALGLPPIRGIVHAAGVFYGGMLGQIERETLRAVLKPKMGGALILHELFPSGSLDFFVLFSSSGQLGRLTGQSCYAAANGFLDGFAAHRNASGNTDSISLGWMAWNKMGMSRSIDATMIETRARGLDAMDSSNALRAWRLCDQLSTHYAAIFTPLIFRGDTTTLPLFSELVSDVKEEKTDEGFKIPIENRQAWLIADVRKVVAHELKLQSEDIEEKRPLVEMGVDSLLTVSLRVCLRKRYGFEFPPTLLWNNPSVQAIAHFIDTHLESSRIPPINSNAGSRDIAGSRTS